MKNKWFIETNRFVKIIGKYWIIPCVSIWYDKYYFLETGVESPAFGIQISWFSWAYGLTIQKGY
jgi:hypothetical protein